MKNRKIPYKLRISRNPVESFLGKDGSTYWTTLRHSLLNEPMAKAILKLEETIDVHGWGDGDSSP